MVKRFAFLIFFFGISFSFLYMRIYCISQSDKIKQVSDRHGSYTLNINNIYGNIFDCNMKPLVNQIEKHMAAVNPTPDGVIAVMPYVKDKEYFNKQLQTGKPFICEVDTWDIVSDDIITFSTKQRNSDNQTACHIVGYTVDNKGMSGIEKSYDDFLRANYTTNKISYQVDAYGKLLGGADKKVELQEDTKAGVITTIDSDIQKICEKSAEKMQMGAIVVLDVKTAEIKALVSCPTYSPLNLEEALHDEKSPFINRALLPYNVGSVFKLVTAATALKDGIDINYQYNCTGKIDIFGQNFNCHKRDGHGILNMKQAMVESCNTYFINIGKKINSHDFINTASLFGFGKQYILADSIVSASGNLQNESDLKNPAEKANMCFGQGKLTATPLQICNMTATIANNGKFNSPTLIKGLTDGYEINYIDNNVSYQAIESPVAYTLKDFMVATVQENATSVARPYNTTAAGKTSTAQTGIFKPNGEEITHAWFTGYFPIKDPKYAVTIFVEDGGSGNLTAGPIFKEIAEKTTNVDKNN